MSDDPKKTSCDGTPYTNYNTGGKDCCSKGHKLIPIKGAEKSTYCCPDGEKAYLNREELANCCSAKKSITTAEGSKYFTCCPTGQVGLTNPNVEALTCCNPGDKTVFGLG